MEDRAYEVKKADAAEALKKLDPRKPWGTRLFDAIARIAITFTIEAVALRRNEKGKLEVYLVQRSLTDTAYPGQWHCPGTAMRKDETFNSALTRLLTGEAGTKPMGSVIPVGIINNPLEERGHFLSYVYLIIGITKETKGYWLLVDQLPTNIVAHHRDHIIPLAIEANERIENIHPVIFKEIEIY